MYNNLSEYATAMDYAQRAVAIGKEINDERLVADSYQSLGIANAYNGEYNAAIGYYKESMVIYEKLKVTLKKPGYALSRSAPTARLLRPESKKKM